MKTTSVGDLKAALHSAGPESAAALALDAMPGVVLCFYEELSSSRPVAAQAFKHLLKIMQLQREELRRRRHPEPLMFPCIPLTDAEVASLEHPEISAEEPRNLLDEE